MNPGASESFTCGIPTAIHFASARESKRTELSRTLRSESSIIECARRSLMRATFLRAAPYADDAMNLPVENVDATIPYYEKTFGFRVVSRKDAPHKSVSLARDNIQIDLAENGAYPTHDGCSLEFRNVH